MTERIPQAINTGLFSASTIRYIWINYKEHLSGESALAPSDRVVCGYPLPAFQRQHKWTEEQERKFIESIWLGLPLGSFTHHKIDWEKGGTPTAYSGYLLDGQQRLTAIQRYWEDKFPVYGLYYSDLTKEEKSRFLSTKFGHFEVNVSNETQMKELYNLMAYGGTAHEAFEKAI